MGSDNNDSNPYRSPRLVDLSTEPTADDFQPPNPIRVLAKWALICGVSAAPSFFFGMIFGRKPTHVAAMFAGILMFVLAYTTVETYVFAQRIHSDPFLRKTLRIGYGTRIAISIIFPIGMWLDVIVGMFAISICQFLVAELNGPPGGMKSSAIAIFFTTIVQGCLLNLVLGGYLALVHTVRLVLAKRAANIETSTDTT